MKTLKDKIRPLMCGDGYDAEARPTASLLPISERAKAKWLLTALFMKRLATFGLRENAVRNIGL